MNENKTVVFRPRKPRRAIPLPRISRRTPCHIVTNVLNTFPAWLIQRDDGAVNIISNEGLVLGVVHFELSLNQVADYLEAPMLRASESAKSDGWGDFIYLFKEGDSFEQHMVRLAKLATHLKTRKSE